MKYTYSHYEKVTIPISRTWWQKLLFWPSEYSSWSRRAWVIDGTLEQVEFFAKVMHGESHVDIERHRWNVVLDEKRDEYGYVPTTGAMQEFIDQGIDTCVHTCGVMPCKARPPCSDYCYNTLQTCKDRSNYKGKTLADQDIDDDRGQLCMVERL
jgi:hypothetical protein